MDNIFRITLIKKKWLKLIGAGCLLLAIIIISLEAFFVYKFYHKRQFSFERWNSVELYSMDNSRDIMYDALVHEYDLVGMKEDEVIRLLGEPQDTDDNSLLFWLGPRSNYGVDYYWLKLTCENDVVVRYEKISD
ncbi:MAG: hypothetical protein PHS44_01865 [Candidatus Dojkabacteria bacterium]|nr:hypothetical protein [Candidatus Dojkabacteria bacterium]